MEFLALHRPPATGTLAVSSEAIICEGFHHLLDRRPTRITAGHGVDPACEIAAWRSVGKISARLP